MDNNEFKDNNNGAERAPRADTSAPRPEGQAGSRPEGQNGGDRNRNNRGRYNRNRPNRRPDRPQNESADGQAPAQEGAQNDRPRGPRPQKQRGPRPDRNNQRPRDEKPDEGDNTPAVAPYGAPAAPTPAAPAQSRESRTVWSSSGKGKRPNRPVAPPPVRPVNTAGPAFNAPSAAALAQAGVRTEPDPAENASEAAAAGHPAAPSANKPQKSWEARRPQQSRPDRQNPTRGAAPAQGDKAAAVQAGSPAAPQAEGRGSEQTGSGRLPGQRPQRMPHKAAKPADLPQMDNLLIEDTPEENVDPGSYVPAQEEVDRILQYETYTPQSHRIPDVIPEGKLVIVGVRFRTGGKTYFFDPGNIRCQLGQHAIVDTARGLEYGEICLSNSMVDESLVVQPLRPLVRVATQEDIEHNRENHEKEAEAYRVCVQKIRVHKLDMKLVTAQYTFDNAKLLFYFTSAGRVDFRELVRDLASVFHIRIELRQIGIRDEARMIGGLGACGRPLCCSTFLSDFGQVSMKMAKEQNLSLNSSKISGVCGRLMCCLRYEYDTYQEEIRRTPAPGTFVMTPDGPGVVTEIYPLPGEVKVSLRDQPDTAPKRYKRTDVSVQAPGSRPGSADRTVSAAPVVEADEDESASLPASPAPMPAADEADTDESEAMPPRLDPDTPSEDVTDEPDLD